METSRPSRRLSMYSSPVNGSCLSKYVVVPGATCVMSASRALGGRGRGSRRSGALRRRGEPAPAEVSPDAAELRPEIRSLVDGEGGQRQGADDDLDDVVLPVHERLDVRQEREEDGAEDRADERRAAAGEARPAEHGGGDALQRVARAGAGRRVARAEQNREEERADRREQRRDDERAPVDARRRRAEAPRRELVEADGAERQAGRRPEQPPVGGGGEHDE